MIKKIIASSIVLLVIGGSVTYAHGNQQETNNDRDEYKVEQQSEESEKLELVYPEENTTVADKNSVMSFTAPQGTAVTVEVYHNTSMSPDEENYILSQDPTKVNIGALQRGWVEIELRRGLNRVDFTAEYENGESESITRFITLTDMTETKKLLENAFNRSAVDILRNITNRGK